MASILEIIVDRNGDMVPSEDGDVLELLRESGRGLLEFGVALVVVFYRVY